jgi:hypothetical protein
MDFTNDYKIKSVSEFVRIITDINNQNEDINYIYRRVPMYYRGQPNFEWDLQPGMFRNSEYEYQLDELIKEFENQYPNEIEMEIGMEYIAYNQTGVSDIFTITSTTMTVNTHKYVYAFNSFLVM